MLGGIQIRYPDTISVTLIATIAAIGYLLYVVFLVIQTFNNPKLETTFAVGQPQKAQETKKLDFTVIKNWNLFGQPETSAAQYGGANEIPQETQLQFKLLGVFCLPSQKKNSFAIIEADDHVQKKIPSGR